MTRYAVTITNQFGMFTYTLSAKNTRAAIFTVLTVLFPEGAVSSVLVTPILKPKKKNK